jgi:hypothetical protein
MGGTRLDQRNDSRVPSREEIKQSDKFAMVGLYALIVLSISNVYLVCGLPPRGPLSEHFTNWLVSNGYEADNFDRPDIGPNGSFGGRLNSAIRVGDVIGIAKTDYSDTQ